jgi:hypothetical protein
MTRSRQTADWGSRAGLAKIVPSSVAVGSGTGSASTTGTVTFSGASTVSLNGVFNSTYTNYKIIMDSLYGSSSSINIVFRLRKSGTDNSDTNSYIRRGFVSSDSALSNQIETGTTFFLTQLNSGSTAPAFVEFELYLPFANNQTGLNSLNFRANDNVAMTTIGRHTTVDTFDGCSFIMSSGTMTGTVSVYGYTI